MSMQDPIADLLTRIRNAQRVNETAITVPASRFKKAILNILQQEGYIETFDELDFGKNKTILKVNLRYHQGAPVIQKVKRISKPSLRVYKNAAEITNIASNMGIVIVSTSKGVMTGSAAKALNVGGEVLCSIE